MQQEQRETALTYHKMGLQVFSIPWGRKVPDSPWKKFQERPRTQSEVAAEFSQLRNIGVLCGAVSKGLYVLDYDSISAYDADRVSHRLDSILSETLVSKTGRGVHVWLRSPGDAVRSSKFDGGDVQGEGKYIIAPRSRHPNGQQYEFSFNPERILELDPRELAFLNLQTIKQRPYGVPAKFWDIVAHGKVMGYYSRSEAEQAVIVYFARQGWSFHQVYEFFERHAAPVTKYRDKDANQAKSYLECGYAKALEYLAAHKRDIDLKIDRLQEIANNPFVFDARTRLVDQSVFQAALTIARRCGKDTLGLSVRELAALSNTNEPTVQRALNRIQYVENIPSTTGVKTFKLIG